MVCARRFQLPVLLRALLSVAVANLYPPLTAQAASWVRPHSVEELMQEPELGVEVGPLYPATTSRAEVLWINTYALKLDFPELATKDDATIKAWVQGNLGPGIAGGSPNSTRYTSRFQGSLAEVQSSDGRKEFVSLKTGDSREAVVATVSDSIAHHDWGADTPVPYAVFEVSGDPRVPTYVIAQQSQTELGRQRESIFKRVGGNKVPSHIPLQRKDFIQLLNRIRPPGDAVQERDRQARAILDSLPIEAAEARWLRWKRWKGSQHTPKQVLDAQIPVERRREMLRDLGFLADRDSMRVIHRALQVPLLQSTAREALLNRDDPAGIRFSARELSGSPLRSETFVRKGQATGILHVVADPRRSLVERKAALLNLRKWMNEGDLWAAVAEIVAQEPQLQLAADSGFGLASRIQFLQRLRPLNAETRVLSEVFVLDPKQIHEPSTPEARHAWRELLSRGLESPDKKVRELAVETLNWMPDRELVPLIERVLRTPDLQIRGGIDRRWPALVSFKVIREYTQLDSMRPDPGANQVSRLWWLAGRTEPEVLAALEKIRPISVDLYEVGAIGAALSYRSDPQSLRLIQRWGDLHHEVVLYALEGRTDAASLEWIRTFTENRNFFREGDAVYWHLHQRTGPEVEALILHAVAEHRVAPEPLEYFIETRTSPDSIDWLRNIAEKQEIRFARSAVRALLKIDDPRARAVLDQLRISDRPITRAAADFETRFIHRESVLAGGMGSCLQQQLPSLRGSGGRP